MVLNSWSRALASWIRLGWFCMKRVSRMWMRRGGGSSSFSSFGELCGWFGFGGACKGC